MRILHVTDRLSARGGADWHLRGAIDELARSHEVALAVGRDDGSARAPCPVWTAPPLARTQRAPGAPSALDAIAAEYSPDVIHLHNAVAPEVLEWGAARGAVATVYDHRGFCPGRGKITRAGEMCTTPMGREACAACFREQAYFDRTYALTERRLTALAALARLVVASDYMRSELAAAGVPRERIAVIPPYPPEPGRGGAREAAGAPCVAFVGRLARAKGVYDAAEAWRRSGTELPLVYAGDGPERERLETAGFAVTGWLSPPGLAELYRRARAVILPSRWQEPFGLVGVEALARGVPVAAWESGGVGEWHPGPLARWGDVNGLADILAEVAALEAPPARARPLPGREELTARLEAVYAAAREARIT